MRGIKKTDSIIFDGYQIYHNCIREHMKLNGKTSAQIAGLMLKEITSGLL